MKKSLYLMAIGAMALSACTSSEVLDQEIVHTNAIGFENVVGKHTRATANEMTNQDFKDFWVYGYYTNESTTQLTQANEVFTNMQVTRGGDKWTYASPRYWIPGQTYYFYALSCAGVPFSESYGKATMDRNASSLAGRALVVNDYKCGNDHQHDLLFARYEKYTAQDPEQGGINLPVSFKFQHILSKLNFVFKSAFPDMYSVQISNIKLEWIYDIASFNVNNNNGWSNLKKTENSGNYINIDMTTDRVSKQTGNNGEVVDIPQASSNIFVIPYNYKNDNNDDVRLQFVIDVYSGEEHVYTHTVYATWEPVWVAGNFYRYTITVEGGNTGLGDITFEADIQSGENGEWTPGEVSPMTVVG